MAEDFDVQRYDDILPPGAVPLYGVRLVVYLDEDGVEMQDFQHDGEVRFGQVFGAVESMKMRMFCHHYGIFVCEGDD